MLKLYPGQIDLKAGKKLIGSDGVIAALESGEDPRAIHQRTVDQLDGFVALRAKYLVYK